MSHKYLHGVEVFLADGKEHVRVKPHENPVDILDLLAAENSRFDTYMEVAVCLSLLVFCFFFVWFDVCDGTSH